jgi:hypothetical protein
MRTYKVKFKLLIINRSEAATRGGSKGGIEREDITGNQVKKRSYVGLERSASMSNDRIKNIIANVSSVLNNRRYDW